MLNITLIIIYLFVFPAHIIYNAQLIICVTFWGYHTLLALKAYHTILAARAYRRLDGSVGIFIDLTSDDSHPGSLLTGCHSGSLSDHENVRGCFGLVR